MPIPKGKSKLYGLVIGRMRNLGKSKKQAKSIAERAVRSKRSRKRR